MAKWYLIDRPFTRAISKGGSRMSIYAILGTLSFGFIGFCIDSFLNTSSGFSIIFAIAAAVGFVVDALEKPGNKS